MSYGQFSDKVIFGCARIRSGIECRRSYKILEGALKIGINKFDLAPSYGEGRAEKVFGDFFSGNYNNIEITTKAGLNRGEGSFFASTVKYFIRPLAKALIGNKNNIKKYGIKEINNKNYGNFDLSYMKSSFYESCEFLKTSRISCLLLHEPRISDISEDLLNLFLKLKKDGLINKFGSGTGGDFVESVLIGDVVQYKYNDRSNFSKRCDSVERRIHGVMRDHDMDWLNYSRTLKSSYTKEVNECISKINKENFGAAKMAALLILNKGERVVYSTNYPERLFFTIKMAEEFYLEMSRFVGREKEFPFEILLA